MIYRGWGFMTLVTPIAGILLLAYFFPHDGPKGNIPLQQVLLGGGHRCGSERAAGPVAQPCAAASG